MKPTSRVVQETLTRLNLKNWRIVILERKKSGKLWLAVPVDQPTTGYYYARVELAVVWELMNALQATRVWIEGRMENEIGLCFSWAQGEEVDARTNDK